MVMDGLSGIDRGGVLQMRPNPPCHERFQDKGRCIGQMTEGVERMWRPKTIIGSNSSGDAG